jgi:NAD(P)-dependent dehydrogenase (short-subunit alcohol dehydrogenase family)
MRPLAVITGTTHGIGQVTAYELARAGLQVVMLCRDLEAGKAVRDDIMERVQHGAVAVLPCDLANLNSVRLCTDRIRHKFGRIQVLINNAGIVSMRHQLSVDGFELTFATNYLGPFLLTGLLLKHMEPTGRIVTVASKAHVQGRLDLDSVTDLYPRYSPTAAYARSKLANVLHSFALARHLAGTGITANCLHPGVVATNLLPRWVRAVKPLVSRVTFDPVRGARTTLKLALSDEVAGVSGQYFDEHGEAHCAAPMAEDIHLQARLWATSVRWVAPTVLEETGTG